MRVFDLFRDGLDAQDVVLATWRPRLTNLTAYVDPLSDFTEPLTSVIMPWATKLRAQLARRWRDKLLTGASFVELGGEFRVARGRRLVTWQPRLKTVLLVPKWSSYKQAAKFVRGCEEHHVLANIESKRLAFELGFYLAYPRAMWHWSSTLHHAMSRALYRQCTNTVFGTYQSGFLVNKELEDAEPQDFAGPVCAGDFDGWVDDGSDHGGVFD